MKVMKVRKWDFERNAPMTDRNGAPVYVEMPTGPELERAVIAAGEGEHIVYGEKCDSIAGTRYLKEQSVRMQDVLDAYDGGKYADLNRVEIRALLTDTGLAPLFPTLTLEGIAEGFNEAVAEFQDLIATTVPVTSGTVEDFQFVDNNDTYRDFILKELGEGARIPTARITVSGKQIYIWDKGRGIDITDRAQDAPVNLADTWLRKLGRTLAKFYKTHVTYRLANGYYEDATDAAFVLYTNGGLGTAFFDLADILTAMQYLRDKGFNPTDIVGSAANIIALEVSTIGTNGEGGYVFPNGIADRLKLMGVHMDDTVGDDEIIILDRNSALVRYELKPFGTEQERTAGQRITSLYATISDEIAMADPAARVLLSKAAP
jgi:hypothetical protein